MTKRAAEDGDAAQAPGKKLKDDLAAFVAWMDARGFRLDAQRLELRVDDTADRIGLFAKVALEDDAFLFHIPADAFLSPSNSSIAELLAGSELSDWFPLIVALMVELKLPSSKWRAYLDLLPDGLETPLFWSEEETKMLAGTDIAERIGGEQVQRDFDTIVAPFMRAHGDVFREDVHTFQLFRLAGSIIMAYAFTDEESGEIKISPMADMLNHVPDHNAQLFEQDMRTIRPVAAGEELFNTYGPLGNADLLRRYGFTVESNPHDFVALDLAPAVGERFAGDSPLARHRRKRLKGKTGIDLDDGDDLVLELDKDAVAEVDDELYLIPAIALIDDVGAREVKPPSKADGARDMVRAAVDARLAAHVDVADLESRAGASSRMRNALRVVQGERQILEQLKKALE